MIDIDDLSEKELIDLNNRIVARVKFLRDMRAHASMLEFSLGERVTFQPDGHPPLFGFVAKYNRKSVTVVTERGQHWTVAPNFLRKVKRVELPAPASGSGVVPIGKRQARDQPGQGRHSSHPRSGKVFYLASAPTLVACASSCSPETSLREPRGGRVGSFFCRRAQLPMADTRADQRQRQPA